jgi:hypothetical protein
VGFCLFFFASFRTFIEDYADLFRGGEQEEDSGQGVAKPDYGWLGVAYVLIAKRDPLKMDAVFAMPARQFMNYVRLAKDLQ